MTRILCIGLMAFGIGAGFAGEASAKGCIKGALVGGVAGHYAGRHGLLGAAAGCAVGRHQANKAQRNADQAPAR